MPLSHRVTRTKHSTFWNLNLTESLHSQQSTSPLFQAVLGVITCALALVAQFHPSKFPANYYLTLFCVLGYYFFNTALQIFSIYRERDVILFTHPAPGSAPGAAGMEVSSARRRNWGGG